MNVWHAIVFIGRLVGPTFYTERFIEYAKNHNIDCYVVDVNKPDTFCCKEFDEFAQRPGTAVFTFNNIGLLLEDKNGLNYWKENNIPVFDFVIDHPRAFPDMLENPKCEIFLFCLDENHVEFAKKYYKKLNGVFFCPHAGASVKNCDIPYRERDIDVIYMGDCQSEISDFPIIDLFEDGGNDFYGSVSTELMNNPLLSTEEAIRKYLQDNNVDVSDAYKFFLEGVASKCIDRSLRRITKLAGMQALGQQGIHVEVYGNNWIDKEYPFSDSIRVHERVGREELLEILCHARISLCYIPWFKAGCSEKNFDSMINGAVSFATLC